MFTASKHATPKQPSTIHESGMCLGIIQLQTTWEHTITNHMECKLLKPKYEVMHKVDKGERRDMVILNVLG